MRNLFAGLLVICCLAACTGNGTTQRPDPDPPAEEQDGLRVSGSIRIGVSTGG